MYFQFKNYKPVVNNTSFVHPQATLIGNVIIGKNCYIGPGAVLRGDWGAIILEDGCNVQENCTIHMFPGLTVMLHEGAHIGHGAVIHGARIGKNSLVGMNSVIMDDVELGPECIVGALTFIREGQNIPARSVVVGNPGKIVRQADDEMIKWKSQGTAIYQSLPKEWFQNAKSCRPLRKIPAHQKMKMKNEFSYQPLRQKGS
jgi:phenylacetic acid degradation protein